MEQTLNSQQPVLRKFDKSVELKKNLILGLISFLVVAVGIGTGWLISGGGKATNTPVASGIKVGTNEAGVADESVFAGESPEGMLVEGGIDGEGTHHIEREGGPARNVYLTSSVVDLQTFVGKKVKVWGETIAPKKAGWLMDVGKIKVIN